jgi:hypothetical protein
MELKLRYVKLFSFNREEIKKEEKGLRKESNPMKSRLTEQMYIKVVSLRKNTCYFLYSSVVACALYWKVPLFIENIRWRHLKVINEN